MNRNSWIEKSLLTLHGLESNEKWLRIGVRVYVLLILWGATLIAIAALESTITGDVSLITRLAWFAYLLCTIPGALVGAVCLAIGLVRRYLFARTPSKLRHNS